mmetsp:Transcript_129732/g.323318  ORF Transcript_129732/g.323318 Transcript_129732/m.323318 type:complete len:269 (-) Transcript_129732:211-1017(-)
MPLANARMLLICNTSKPECEAMASSMRCTPPASTKALKACMLVPINADMPSMAATCTLLSLGNCCINCVAARIAPASTNRSWISGRPSLPTICFVSDNQPTAALPRASGPSCTEITDIKPATTESKSKSSLPFIWEIIFGTALCQAAWPVLAVRKRVASGLFIFPPCRVAAPALPSRITSGATIRARASLACLLATSFGSVLPTTIDSKIPSTLELASLSTTTVWLKAIFDNTRVAAICTCASVGCLETTRRTCSSTWSFPPTPAGSL